MSNNLPTLEEFRAKRDAFQLARREAVKPVLEVQAGNLIDELAVIRQKVAQKRRLSGGMLSSHKSDLDHLEDAKTALWRDLSPILGQLSVIDPHTPLIDMALGIDRSNPLRKAG